ncbi:MAG TPA: hypothetical protein VHN36_20125 [Ilumatobacteraceae bacterium]|nr:hypothetical protein [Ilumatobacteraceae bacterium]
MSDESLDPKLAPVVDALIAGCGATFEPSFVRSLVVETAAEFDGVPVRDYVELLVTKQAADELRRLHAARCVGSSR